MGDRPSGFGYLLKPRIGDLEDFAASVRRVARGGTAIDPIVVGRLAGRDRQRDPLDELTPRELEVLELIAEGRSNRSIAGELVVTVAAVERHITSIFAKLCPSSNGADHRRVLAALRYLDARSIGAKICATGFTSSHPFEQSLARNGGTAGRVPV
jgi:DNA-binding NarL/FixJ family response regulator